MQRWPKTMLMVNPEHFDVIYNINPHMVNEKGELNKVDRPLAQQQWRQLKNTFESLGMTVEVLPGQPNLPDMVFCANQTFPFLKNGEKHIILSRMNSSQRQPEVQYFKEWAEKKHIVCHELPSSLFEGMGDALWNYEKNTVFAGYGFRTSPEIYSLIEQWVGVPIITFELRDERFYHLDTCLSILGKDTAVYVPEAFTPEGLNTLKAQFSRLIALPLNEALEQFAANLCTPNGQDIIIQTGANQTCALLKAAGYRVHEVETSEFMKSGGSVFCMKQLLF